MMCEKSIEQRALNHKAKQQKEQRERERERGGEGKGEGYFWRVLTPTRVFASHD